MVAVAPRRIVHSTLVSHFPALLTSGRSQSATMSFFRSIWKGSSKHKKLYDEWALASVQDDEKEEQAEEASFTLKYLGSTIVSSAASETATADAVKVILTLSKAASKKTPRVAVTVSQRGIRVTNLSSNESQLEISIYRISYCSADANNSHVFAFIATNPDETLECHAFLCPKRKVAQTVSLTVAQMFNTAFQEWQITQEQLALSQGRSLSQSSDKESDRETSASPEMGRTVDRDQTGAGLLIDLDSIVPSPNNTWVNFDNENIPDYNFSSNYDVMNGNDKFGTNFGNMNAMWDQSKRMACS